MRTKLAMLCRFALPILAVLGSTLTVNPILAAEPAEELKAIRELLKKIDERMENQNTISLQMLERQKLEFTQLKNDLTQLRDDIAQARRDLADLRGRPNGNSS
jgi:septal ring factor EnvC (AmiA/AmiB activator)